MHQKKSMLYLFTRLHRHKMAKITVVLLILCLAVIFLLHQQLSKPYRRGVPDIDPELWRLLGPQDLTKLKPAVTPQLPQIHIKNIPPIIIKNSWTIREVEEQFFRFVENKDIKCERDLRLGSWNDGGWNVCMSPPYKLLSPCVVFSFGIGDDWQFDDSIANGYSCTVLAFDPSIPVPRSMRSPLIHFRKIGLGAKNERNSKGWDLKTLRQHFKDEGYWGVTVDYVKMDIELMEWDVLKQVIRDGSLEHVKQLGFEMHTPELSRIYKKANQTLPERNQTAAKLEFIQMFETLHALERIGFKKFNYRMNPFGDYKSVYTSRDRSCCYELHYINTRFLTENNTIVHSKDSPLFH
ncbi:unnamed protein product [Lymnaea stagnalis]|uniref:Methyltransferase domain-containing protein n=1 Tax=Lymnaea stagnalis TaxID=6523 RepID=A0AAV2H383_LYMST